MGTKEKVTAPKAEDSVWVYSQLLKKPFATLDELKEAEDEYNKAHAEEIRRAEERKVRAKEVEDAYKATLDVRRQAKEIIDEANRKASEMIRNAEGHYNNVKEEFIKDYGSFHMSYTNNNGNTIVSVSDLFDSMFKNFWF